ncbi:MAG: glycerol acyltransferase [Desulfobacteraceae bacterium]|nr:glycerol acyltransferase [Desulfobacteraceae bacterium]
MTPTLLNNFILRPIFYWLATCCLFILGWKAKGKIPEHKKFILIAAPHSSNWDFVIFLLIIFKFKLPVHWMGKHTMFIWPFKWILKRLGGIPIDRSEKSNVVQNMANAFKGSKNLIITIAPSGTREKVMKWKTGFYHIANQAKVPVACGFIDYKQKISGIGPVFDLSGCIETDMKPIKLFYSQFSGKHLEKPTL